MRVLDFIVSGQTVKASGLLSVTYPQDTTYTLQRILATIQALGGAI